MNDDKVKRFLTNPNRKGLINISGIEREAGIPKTKLRKYLSGKVDLTDVQVVNLVLTCKELGFKP